MKRRVKRTSRQGAEGTLDAAYEELAGDSTVITHLAMLEVCENILERMKRLKINRSNLARRAKMDPAMVSRILSAEHNVTVATLGRIASALDFSELWEMFTPRMEVTQERFQWTDFVFPFPSLWAEPVDRPLRSWEHLHIELNKPARVIETGEPDVGELAA